MATRPRLAGLSLVLVLALLGPGRLGASPFPLPSGDSHEPPVGAEIDGRPDGSSCPVDPPTPVVKIRVRVPATALANEEIEYRIGVENTSSAAAAHHVSVHNPLPANARFVRAEPEPAAREP